MENTYCSFHTIYHESKHTQGDLKAQTYLSFRFLNFWQDRTERLDDFQEFNCRKDNTKLKQAPNVAFSETTGKGQHWPVVMLAFLRYLRFTEGFAWVLRHHSEPAKQLAATCPIQQHAPCKPSINKLKTGWDYNPWCLD